MADAGRAEPLLERAIGVIYRPATELASHYFEACLPRQFDEGSYRLLKLVKKALDPDNLLNPGKIFDL